MGGQRPQFTSHVISHSFSFLIHKVRIVTLTPPRNAMRVQVLCEVVDACALMRDQRRSFKRVSQQQWRKDLGRERIETGDEEEADDSDKRY